MDVGLAPILFVLVVSMTAVQSQIQKGPANALKKVGDRVTLVCVTVNKNCDQVEWQKVEGMQSPKIAYRNGIGMLNSDLYPTQRYSVNSTGGCSLTIRQLELGDSGRFMCVLAVDSGEETKSSILVVISVRESCLSNVTGNVLAKDDGYSLWCAINIPAKSVEPSYVTLNFQNTNANEITETTNGTQLHTVKTTLTGTAIKENITQRVCRASFPPNTEANYDNTTAFLNVCTTQKLIVSPVRSQIQRGPANAVKEVGNCVTLKCVTVKKNCDQVEWQKLEGLQSPKLVYRNGIGMLNSDLYPPQRYSVSDRYGCSLTITQLEINDSGRFICVLAVGSGEVTRSSILVVINVAESCVSNVTSNELTEGDGYSFWCAINIPAKSVEPSNVTLSFQNKAVGETNTTDVKQPLTVKATISGTANEENITQRVCRASVAPNTEANYDSTTATLDVCTTQQLTVSHPVENIAVSTPGPYYKGDTVRCTADGHPSPTFKWTHSKSRDVVVGDTLMIKGDVGDKCICTATSVVKGRVASQNITIDVSIKPNPVVSITVSTSGPYSKSDTVGSTADVHPSSTAFKWTLSKSDTMGDTSGDYTSTATNTVEGGETHMSMMPTEVSSPSPPSNPVVSIIVSTSGPYSKGDTVGSTADGRPSTTFKWTLSKSDTMGDTSGDYTSTATNMVEGRETHMSMMPTEVSSPSPPSTVQSHIQRVPANALKRATDSVTLDCVTVNKNCDQVEWQKVEGLQSPKLVYRYGQGMLNSDLYPPQRYSVISTGGCSLTITQLEIGDSGRFICMHAVGSGEETRTAILVVIGLRESCISNVTSKALDKGDGYSLWCAINIPPKSVEPSNVTLSFQNKAVGETETTDGTQLDTVKTTLTGVATKENITRVCRASLSPNRGTSDNSTTATLDVCAKQWIVSSVQLQIGDEPKSVLKRAGESYTLPCVMVNKNCDQVEWWKVEDLQPAKLVYQTGKGMLNNDLFPIERYSVNDRDGFSLTITRLQSNDSGRFICGGCNKRKRRSSRQVDSVKETKTSILVVINVAESCESNVTSNALDKDDGYSLWCTINIPPESVEPSNVTLSFQNKAVGETETTNGTQLDTVKTTLTGVATKENITLVCRASLPPNRGTSDNSTTAILDVCTKQWIVSYPVENINVSLLSGNDGTVRCTADGHPPPTFKWIHLKSGDVVDGDTLMIQGDIGDKYTCTATNMVKRKETSQNITTDLDFFRLAGYVAMKSESSDPEVAGYGPGSVAGAVIGALIGGGIIGCVCYAGLKDDRSRLYVWLHSRKKKKNDIKDGKVDVPSYDSTSSGPPTSNYTPNSEVA